MRTAALPPRWAIARATERAVPRPAVLHRQVERAWGARGEDLALGRVEGGGLGVALVQEGADALVIDVAGPHRCVLSGDDLHRIAAQWRPVRLDDGCWGWLGPAATDG